MSGAFEYAIVGLGILLASSTVAQTNLIFLSGTGSSSSPLSATNGWVFRAVPTGATNGGRAEYQFTNQVASAYRITAVVQTQSNAPDAFGVNIDAEPVEPGMTWDVPAAKEPVTLPVSWRGVGSVEKPQFAPKLFFLSPGGHRLIIRTKTAGTKLNSVTIEPAEQTRPVPPTGLRSDGGS